MCTIDSSKLTPYHIHISPLCHHWLRSGKLLIARTDFRKINRIPSSLNIITNGIKVNAHENIYFRQTDDHPFNRFRENTNDQTRIEEKLDFPRRFHQLRGKMPTDFLWRLGKHSNVSIITRHRSGVGRLCANTANVSVFRVNFPPMDFRTFTSTNAWKIVRCLVGKFPNVPSRWKLFVNDEVWRQFPLEICLQISRRCVDFQWKGWKVGKIAFSVRGNCCWGKIKGWRENFKRISTVWSRFVTLASLASTDW